ncbi:gatA, partial [Symbiodinium pilosum]
QEYTSLLVRRARYYRYMNQWIFRSYDLLDVAVKRAAALDKKAAKEGVDALAPLYGLPIPMKGTAAVVDFPSGCGVGILSQYTPVKNSELTDLIYKRNGIILGTTNVSEDTGGSTRVPALFNGLFGSWRDILFYDRALMQQRHNAEALHNAAQRLVCCYSTEVGCSVGTPLPGWLTSNGSNGDFQDSPTLPAWCLVKCFPCQLICEGGALRSTIHPRGQDHIGFPAALELL